MPIQLFSQLQTQPMDLSGIPTAGQRAQTEHVQALTEQTKLSTAKTQAVQQAVQSSVAQGPDGKPIVDYEGAYNKLVQIDVKTANDFRKAHLDDQIHQSTFEEAQASRHLENVRKGAMLIHSGLTQDGMSLINQGLPPEKQIVSMQASDKDNYVETLTDGSKQNINMPKFIESLQTSKDLYSASQEMARHMHRIQKEFAPELVKAGVIVNDQGQSFKMNDLLGAYKDANARALSLASDPTQMLILQKTNPDGYLKAMNEIANLKDPLVWIKDKFGVDLSGKTKPNLIPAEQVGGKKGGMVAKTPGGTAPKIQDLPASAQELKGGQIYQTSRGPAKWDAERQVFEIK